ncbi:putative DNA-binding transcriptional regulator YafY [Nocardioides thalensis]|uniref:Putative DNA-binding transcriptional regulator YafY n=1 Tax=Nocardioides thalensis TaxID=1914755 RepID=A0A853C7P6_9ACTN|nr:WYL domain-containing protein [Nocardioides thalensis]NYJ02253.1 putative DNA-binding transcriptional regulator YafY [Nocardioides thalensis]
MGDDDPTKRTLRLLALLQARRTWLPAELADRLGVSTRTLRRDISRLEDLDFRVERKPGPGGYYALAAGSRLPPLVFDDDEVLALIVGLRMAEGRVAEDAAPRALAKLLQVLPRRLSELAHDLAENTQTVRRPRTVVDGRALDKFARAGAASRSVEFTYRDQRGRTLPRRVDSVQCVQSNGRWYAVAYDLDREAWRVFLLDGATDVHLGPIVARRQTPFADLSTWLTTDFGRLGDRS